MLLFLKASAVVVVKKVQVILADLCNLIPAVEEIESFVFRGSFGVGLTVVLCGVLPINSHGGIVLAVFVRRLARQTFGPGLASILEGVQILNHGVASLAEAKNCEISDSVEHVVVVG